MSSFKITIVDTSEFAIRVRCHTDKLVCGVCGEVFGKKMLEEYPLLYKMQCGSGIYSAIHYPEYELNHLIGWGVIPLNNNKGIMSCSQTCTSLFLCNPLAAETVQHDR